MNAGRKLFSRFGYANTSMRMIASVARVSTGGLYLYFENKQSLYLSLIRELMSDIESEHMRILDEAGDPGKAIREFVLLNMQHAKKHRQLIMQTREIGFSFGSEMKKQFFRKQIKIIESIVKRGVDEGIFEPCDVRKTAGIIQGAQRGFIISMIFDESSKVTPDECSNFILRALSRRSPR